MAERKRFDSLIRGARPFLAVFLAAGLMVFFLLAVLAESGRAQNAGVDGSPAEQAPLQEDGRLQAAREGTYPAQLAGSTGAVRPSRFGPQRHDPMPLHPTITSFRSCLL